ncbi:Crp/Fnr family transcriptional regulator [Mucilaginibacter koreensis]
MFTEFETYLRNQAQLTDAQLDLLKQTAVHKKVSRKQALLQKGEVCRYKIFIIKGLLRMYRTTHDGSEHIIQFCPDLSWTTEAESYNNQTPSQYYIDALEDSELLMWNKSDFDQLFVQIPTLKVYSERLISHTLVLSRNRVFNSISLSPEEKYDDFIETYPGLLARVPLRMVASYLGVSVKTLTRIRHAQLQR